MRSSHLFHSLEAGKGPISFDFWTHTYGHGWYQVALHPRAYTQLTIGPQLQRGQDNILRAICEGEKITQKGRSQVFTIQ